MKSRFWLLLIVSITLLANSCNDKATNPFSGISVERLDGIRKSNYTLSNKKIRFYIDSLRLSKRDTSYIDLQTNSYYAKSNGFLWIDRFGIDERCNSVIDEIEKLIKLGFNPRTFRLDIIKADLNILRTLDLDQNHNINLVMARIEYNLTRAYLRYVNGQQFGFVNPRKLFNYLDHEQIDSIKSGYKTLYDIASATAGKAFIETALHNVTNDSLTYFLQQVQPENETYHRLEKEYSKPTTTKEQKNILFVNMERARWQTSQKKGDKYVEVNLPSFELKAIDKGIDSSLTMRICCGQKRYKTPLLTSEIKYVEFNPYWVVPQSIIRKEIAPLHAQDLDYFERNRMKITDKSSGEELDPETVTASMLNSGKYRIRQEKGEGNSLGRIIFRFPNNFSIYLHDTDNKEAFKRASRSVSHGCVRVEKPLELAVFLLQNKTPYLIDRIRVAIDLPPHTEEGKALINKEGYKNIGSQNFNPTIPIYITYTTSCIDANGRLSYYPDIYGYDSVILERIRQY